jgi:hypothetical protein
MVGTAAAIQSVIPAAAAQTVVTPGTRQGIPSGTTREKIIAPRPVQDIAAPRALRDNVSVRRIWNVITAGHPFGIAVGKGKRQKIGRCRRIVSGRSASIRPALRRIAIARRILIRVRVRNGIRRHTGNDKAKKAQQPKHRSYP